MSLKTGYHNLDPGFATLSAAAIPGVEEVYGGANWVAKKWMTLGVDANTSKNKTLALPFTPSQTTETHAQTARANFKLHPETPDWSFSLQKNNSETTSTANPGTSKNVQSSAGVRYDSPVWAAALNYLVGELRNEMSPTLDSDTTNWQFNLSRPFKNFTDWNISAVLSYGVQDQHLLTSSSSTVTTTRSLTVSGEHPDVVSFSATISDGTTSRPDGLSDLDVLSKQLDVSHPFSKTSLAKLFYRTTESNLSDPLLGVEEQTTGIEYTYAF